MVVAVWDSESAFSLTCLPVMCCRRTVVMLLLTVMALPPSVQASCRVRSSWCCRKCGTTQHQARSGMAHKRSCGSGMH